MTRNTYDLLCYLLVKKENKFIIHKNLPIVFKQYFVIFTPAQEVCHHWNQKKEMMVIQTEISKRIEKKRELDVKATANINKEK